MALPASGTVSLSMVNTELQRAASTRIGMNENPVRYISNMLSGTNKMSAMRGQMKTLYGTFGDMQNANLYTAMGSPTVAVVANITLNGVCYSANPDWSACWLGSGWPSGSIVNITNNGNILGAAGRPGNYYSNGGAGGTALNIEIGAIRINVTNNGLIYGGGGGGGSGGDGGAGGRGGNGFYDVGRDVTAYPGRSANVATSDWHYACRVSYGDRAWCNAGAHQFYGDCYQSCGGKDGSCSNVCPTLYTYCDSCAYTYTVYDRYYTGGGAGGARIRGGNGGWGYGWDRQWANSNQPEGSPGYNGGAGGGTNAGAGGRSGYGGAGGWGGGWGAYGSNGNNGEGGATGGGGWSEGGYGGEAGGGAAGGGRAGYWIEHGTANWGWTNTNGVAGLER